MTKNQLEAKIKNRLNDAGLTRSLSMLLANGIMMDIDEFVAELAKGVLDCFRSD